ncbi:MAG: hypothetical protein AAF500_06305 [Myxococcota bacterium]
MAPSSPRRWPKRLLMVLGVLVIFAVVFNHFYLADLRPDSLVADSPEARTAGTERLQALAQAHGDETWRQYQVMDVAVTDEWQGEIVQRTFMHWAESPQSLHGRFLRGAWTGELELLSGPDAGDRWGIQSWKTWKAKPGGEPVFAEDPTIEFVVPTTQYFLELPLRIQSANVVLDAGEVEWNGRTYDLVFATWDSLEPRADMDQYVLWIDQDTGLLARTDFTVRDEGGGAVGSAHYLDYADFGGVQMAKEIAIYGLLPGGIELPVHTYRTENVAWDTVPIDTLRPDPTLPSEGEFKPGL